MAWLGVSSPWGFEVRGEGLVCKVNARGVRIEKTHPLAVPALFLLLLVLVGFVALADRRWLFLLLPFTLPFLLAYLVGFPRLRRWHGAEHKVGEALFLVEKGLPPEEAWRRAPILSPACGTVALGLSLPFFPLGLIWPVVFPLAPALGFLLHAMLPMDSPLRFPGLLVQKLFVAEPSPVEEARAREAFFKLLEALEGRRAPG
ncbi:hypothetical protein [Thermus islandicus]|uniref:hypothetical protein n=1 Tax=Thermus islandicus TaxID=540988 RepID=UPI000410C1E2|nr:hypothetical protein [Thermus islandicus]